MTPEQSYLNQLHEIKDYLEVSVKDADKYKKKYDEIAEHTHNYSDVYKARIFEGMAEAYSDILERYFKEKERMTDLELVELMMRYDELKEEYEQFLCSDICKRIEASGNDTPSLWRWVQKFKD